MTKEVSQAADKKSDNFKDTVATVDVISTDYLLLLPAI